MWPIALSLVRYGRDGLRQINVRRFVRGIDILGSSIVLSECSHYRVYSRRECRQR